MHPHRLVFAFVCQAVCRELAPAARPGSAHAKLFGVEAEFGNIRPSKQPSNFFPRAGVFKNMENISAPLAPVGQLTVGITANTVDAPKASIQRIQLHRIVVRHPRGVLAVHPAAKGTIAVVPH